MRRNSTSNSRQGRDRNRYVADRNYGSAGAYSTNSDMDLEYGDMDQYSEEDWEDDFEEFDERYEAPQRPSFRSTADEWLDDDYTRDFDHDEGYDNSEFRSVRRDFDHDYDDSVTGRGFRNYNDRNERYDRLENNRYGRSSQQGYNRGSNRNQRSDRNEGFGDRGFAARGGYSGGSDYHDDYSGGSGYRGGSSSRYGNSNQQREEDFENESRLDLRGGESSGRSIRDRQWAEHGSNSSRKRSAQENTDRDDRRRASRERTKDEEWDENPEDYFGEEHPETSRRASLYQGVRTKGVKNKSMTQGGFGSGNPKGRVATEKAEKARRRRK